MLTQLKSIAKMCMNISLKGCMETLVDIFIITFIFVIRKCSIMICVKNIIGMLMLVTDALFKIALSTVGTLILICSWDRSPPRWIELSRSRGVSKFHCQEKVGYAWLHVLGCSTYHCWWKYQKGSEKVHSIQRDRNIYFF